MPVADFDDVTIRYLDEGKADGPPVVFVHSLGVTLKLWDRIVPLLSDRYRLVRMDNRGHGGSSVPPAPYTIGRLTRDLERLIEHLGLDRPVVVGLSIGGQMAQALAAKRPGWLRGVVLAATGLKIANPQMWQGRIETVKAGGVEALADAAAKGWFSDAFAEGPEFAEWRDLLAACPAEGYMGACAALGSADLIATSSVLHLPALAVVGSEDKGTPPDLVREMADTIPHCGFALIRGAGHLFPVEKPEETAQVFSAFFERAFGEDGK
jgi:3-oxoadipate enol-lactonase